MSALLAIVFVAGMFFVTADISRSQFMCVEEPSATPGATPGPEFTRTLFPDTDAEITIFAAASLTDAFDEIAREAESEHPNLTITIETAGSQTLVTQLEEGARADVLATADVHTMQRAQAGGLIIGEPVTFTGNHLVVVTRADNQARIESLDDLATDDIRLVLANPDVPAGRYTALALCAYAETVGAPDQFLDRIYANIVSQEPDVRHVLTKVLLGEADAGVVYASDVTAGEKSGVALHLSEFPETVTTRAEYSIGAVEGGDRELAHAFISYLLSDAGQEILARHGFD